MIRLEIMVSDSKVNESGRRGDYRPDEDKY